MEVKVCIIGDTDVGKTSLSMRFVQGEFPDNSTPTIGASFLQHRVTVDGVEISLQIWDTAGQERFRSMAPMYYRNAKAAVLVFDVTNEETFNRCMSWLRDLKAHADPNVVLCVAGNKCDRKAAFDLSTCDEFAATVGGRFFKTSALSGEGVNELFDELIRRIAEQYKDNAIKKSKDNLVLNNPSDNEPEPSSCC